MESQLTNRPSAVTAATINTNNRNDNLLSEKEEVSKGVKRCRFLVLITRLRFRVNGSPIRLSG
jgi:hypothetical protein